MGMYGRPRRDPVVCGPTKTRQSMKDECDINNIVARFAKSGFLTHPARGAPVYADVSEMGDFRSALEYVREAQEKFMELPARVRAGFDNDPAKFLDFVSDDTKDEAAWRDAGLLPVRAKDAEASKAPVPVENPKAAEVPKVP